MNSRPSPRFLGRSKTKTPVALPGPAPIPHTMLALVPQPELGVAIHDVLRASGLHYIVPTQITLAQGLDARLEDDWRIVVESVTERHAPFRVRMRGPEIIADRTVVLRVVDQTTMMLRDDLNRALRASGYMGDQPLSDDILFPIAGTWTDLNKVQVHELAASLRDVLDNPVEFRAASVYTFQETAEDDLPRDEFPLRGVG